MSLTERAAMNELCRISAAPSTATLDTTSDPLLDRTRAIWTAGDFSKIAAGYTTGAAAFVKRLRLSPPDNVLDVACGTGNLAIPAAHAGASVTGIDIAPNLIDIAREDSATQGLDIRFDVGMAEALPYENDTFDVVMSMFGVMFSPRPEIALAELVRVTRPGGCIALASWTPGGFIGEVLRAHTGHVPPPAGEPSVLAWGDPVAMRDRLAPHAVRIGDVQFQPRTIEMTFGLTPGGVVELFREFYGPSVKAFSALGAEGRASLNAELLRMWTNANSSGGSTTSVDAQYLEVQLHLC